MLYRNKKYNFSKSKAFTLVETLVGVGVFLVVSTAAYQAYVSLFSLINQNQYKIIALNLANEQFEIVRNMAYSDVGIQGGIPNGNIPAVQNLNRGGVDFVVTATARNIDLPFDGTLGESPNDLSPADNKLVEINIDCPTCPTFTPLSVTTRIAPKNLETASTNGALFIRVFDANGVAVEGANVHIENNQTVPAISINDVTDVNGMLQIIDAPPGVEAYEITVSKSGYSSDMTYTHATVAVQQVTQVSFSIDKLSSIGISSVTPLCVPVGNMNFSLTGSKLTGAGLPKYSENLSTNGSGEYSNNSLEWGTYILDGIDTVYDIVGINPLNPVTVNPDSNQDINLIVAPKDPRSLLITVKDSITSLPITDATVNVTMGAYDETQITDRGFVTQTDWSTGVYTDQINLDIDNPAGELRLEESFGLYDPAGILESSTFDTGSASNFHNIIWSPNDQPVMAGAESVRLQIASNSEINATTTWDYVGPDGTSATYYTSSNSTVSPVHNGDRYIRYKVYLSTENSSVTPNISDISFTVTSSCTPPGQVIFTGLSTGTYSVSVSKTGYTTVNLNVDVTGDWKEQEIILSP